MELPYPVSVRRSIDIDYHSARPDGSTSGSTPSKWDARAARRADLVLRWRELCARNPGVSKTRLANVVAGGATGDHVSGRSIMLWAEKHDAGGVKALRDRYVAPPRKSLTLDRARAEECVLVCAWWAFRIGDTVCIDTKMMHAADALLDRYDTGSILPTIDCYYAWPCDRDKFRFKTFQRWSRYDFQIWLFRACDENDYRRAVKILEGADVRLLDPPTVNVKTIADGFRGIPDSSRAIPDVKTRQSDVLHRANRAALSSLAEPHSGRVRCADLSASVAPAANEPQAQAHDSSSSPLEPTLADLQNATRARSIRKAGFHRAAIEVAAHVNTGIPAVAASPPLPRGETRGSSASPLTKGGPQGSSTSPLAKGGPQGSSASPLTKGGPQGGYSSLGAFVASLNDDYRRMFLRAGEGDSRALAQVVVTFPLWSGRLPDADRAGIERHSICLQREGYKPERAALISIKRLVAAIAADPSLGSDLNLAARVPLG